MTPRPLSQKSSPVVVNSILTEKQPHTVPSLLYCNGSKNVSSMNILQWKTASWEASGLDYGLFIVVKRQFVALPRAVPHNASCKYTHTRQQAGLLQSLLMQGRRERSLPSALYRKIVKKLSFQYLRAHLSRKPRTNMLQKSPELLLSTVTLCWYSLKVLNAFSKLTDRTHDLSACDVESKQGCAYDRMWWVL